MDIPSWISWVTSIVSFFASAWFLIVATFGSLRATAPVTVNVGAR